MLKLKVSFVLAALLAAKGILAHPIPDLDGQGGGLLVRSTTFDPSGGGGTPPKGSEIGHSFAHRSFFEVLYLNIITSLSGGAPEAEDPVTSTGFTPTITSAPTSTATPASSASRPATRESNVSERAYLDSDIESRDCLDTDDAEAGDYMVMGYVEVEGYLAVGDSENFDTGELEAHHDDPDTEDLEERDYDMGGLHARRYFDVGDQVEARDYLDIDNLGARDYLDMDDLEARGLWDEDEFGLERRGFDDEEMELAAREFYDDLDVRELFNDELDARDFNDRADFMTQ